MNETFRILNINFLMNITMNKITLYIHVVNLPSLRCNNGQNQPNRVHLCNRCKCICVVHSVDFIESFGNQDILILQILTIKKHIGYINPLTLNQFPFGRQRNQLPSFIVLQRLELFLHGWFPSWVNSCFLICLRIISNHHKSSL